MSNVDKVFNTTTKEHWMTTSELARATGLTGQQVSSCTWHLNRVKDIRSQPSADKGNEFIHMRLRTTRGGRARRNIYSRAAVEAATPAVVGGDPLDRLITAAAELELEVRKLREFKDKFDQLMGE